MEKKDFLQLCESVNITQDEIMFMALETEFIQRVRTIKPLDMLHSMCIESTKGTVSYNDLASLIETNGTSVSPQALCKKMTPECLSFFEKILALIIKAKIDSAEIKRLKHSCQFLRILVQDSTIIRLPPRLFEIFSGVSNNHSTVCNARIQCVYDLLSDSFISFTIDPYSKNDLAAAPDLGLQKGDLILRDRGYLTQDEIERHKIEGAYLILRYKHKMILLDPKTEKPIDILKKLKANNHLDMEVMLNNNKQTIVRLVASPVNEQTANNRRLKAKKENKNTPSKEYLQELGWSIYITTIPKKDANYISIYKMYSLRWRIEIIFKCWKSNMGFTQIHNVSQIQLSVLLIARFIMILICSQLIFKPCRIIIKKHLQKDLSMMKLTKYLVRNPSKIMEIVRELNEYNGEIENQISVLARYCSYDKRKRKNFQQEMELTFPLS